MSDLKARLEQAGKKAEEQKAEKQARTVKGAHLKEQIEALVNGSGLEVVKNTGFLKVIGNQNKNKILVAIKGGRVDLSGFTIEDAAVIQVTEEDAKAKHLGKVRGFVNFEASDEAVIAVITKAIEILKTPAVTETKPAAKKTAKVEAATEPRAEA